MLSKKTIENALVEIRKRPANYDYFFNNINSPGWIEPLIKKGFFKNPPRPVSDGSYVSFPYWPESRYLIKVASKAPELTLRTALNFSNTENVRVHEDIIEIALQIPAIFSKEIVPKAKEWMKSTYRLLVPVKLGSLIEHLAKGGQVDASLDLAKILLAVQKKEYKEGGIESDNSSLLTKEAQPAFDIWDYKDILEKHIPSLVDAAGQRPIALLCELLANVISFKYEGAEPKDYSYMWRPAIENHAQNRGVRGLHSVLVSAIRDASEHYLRHNPGKASEILNIFKSQPWKVFKRLCLHILRVVPDTEPNLVSSYLTDLEAFNDLYCKYEYAMLLRTSFSNLSSNDRAIILGWVDKGPDLELRKEGIEARQLTEEDVKRHIRYWKRDKLALFGDALPDEWKRIYEDIVRQLGPPEHPEFSSYVSSGWVGPTSPISVEELEAMSTDELIKFLKEWGPPEGFMEPSPEGLGRLLSKVVAGDPKGFSQNATRFCGLEATYIRAFIRGLIDADKQKRVLVWKPILELCKWVVKQPRNFSAKKLHADSDIDWSATWKEVVRLIGIGFEEGPAEIPFGLRTEVWSVLQPLTSDPEPSKKYEEQYGGTNMDPSTMSINTTRGEAMHSVVRYALWVRRNMSKECSKEGLSVLPEVKEVLELHLNPEIDPSLAIRAVYGQWFPWLVLIDKSWAAKNRENIFATDEKTSSLGDAAWDTYITINSPYNDTFELLVDEYRHAILQLDFPCKDKEAGLLTHSEENLVGHLICFYLRGKICLDNPGNLLSLFYEKAPKELRKYAIEFIGRNFGNINEDVHESILNCAKSLWEHRFNAGQDDTEFSAFGWWFISGKPNDSWLIAQLEEVLKRTGKIDPVHMVVEHLVKLAPEMPLAVLRCLSLIIEGEKKSGGIYGFTDHARSIFKITLHSSDLKIKQMTQDIIHKLGSYGFLDFRDLLSELN